MGVAWVHALVRLVSWIASLSWPISLFSYLGCLSLILRLLVRDSVLNFDSSDAGALKER